MLNDDLTLLREYSRNHSESAFASLVERHINLVHSVALRQVGDAHLAEEITQAVFIILARKADKLSHHTVLSGWLCRTARYVSLRAMRGEWRRQQREQEAHMQSILNEPESETWTHIAPLLDGALEQLGRKDHDALVLRFFENKNFAEVGAALGASEDAAKMRVSRALEKLRKFFTKRGVDSTTAIIAGAISANSVQAAPVGLAKAVTAIAMAKGVAASGSTLILVKGALKIMAWGKLKIICGFGVAVLLAGSVVGIYVTSAAQNATADDGERYQIDGEVLYHRPSVDYITSQSPSYDDVRHFTLTVNGSNWAIHLTDPQMHGIQYEEVVQLNGSVYRYDYYGKPSPGASINSGSAVIKYGDFPEEDGTLANFVGAGLASSAYFARATDGKVASLWSRPQDASTYKVRANWQLNSAPPHLPTSIDYFHGSEEQRPTPFDNGWKEAQLRVLAETNVGNMAFPLVFTCEQLWPKRNGAVTSNDVEQAAIFTINVHAIRLDSVPDVLPPKTEGTTAVGETRFPNNTADKQTVYFSTLDRLPEKLEEEAIKAYKQQAASHSTMASLRRIKSGRLSNHKWIWLSAILIISTIAVIVGLMKSNRRK
jgi:RNA polymerase sigma factor (sigma-70 family)